MTCCHIQGKIADNRSAVSIGKADVIKGDVPFTGRTNFSIRCINNLGLFLQQLIKTLEACHTALIYLNEA